MTIRTFLAKGDWAGQAEIIEGLPNDTYREEDGRVVDLATVYMKTYCHACKKAGHISPAGYRLPSIAENGQEFALSGDINICDCKPAPVFYAVRNMTATITSEDIARMRAVYAPAHFPQPKHARENASPTEGVDAVEYYFEIVDAKTEVPIEGMTYKLLSDHQVLVYEAKLESGKTRAFSATDHPRLDLVAWIAGDVR